MCPCYILRRDSGTSLSSGSVQTILTKPLSQAYVLVEFWGKTAEKFGPTLLLTMILIVRYSYSVNEPN